MSITLPTTRAPRTRRSPTTTGFPGLLARAKLGDDRAVTALFRDVQPDLMRHLRARSHDDADDIAAQAWLEVARRLGDFEGDHGDFRAWVFTIAHRRLSNHRRAFGRRWSWLTGTVSDDAPAPDMPDREALERMSGDAAASLVADLLPDRQAEVVLLRVVGGFSAEEVAELLGTSQGNVRVVQHRALRRLAEQLGDDLGGL